MRQDTTKSDGGADQGVELFVTTNGELEVARGNTLDLEVLGGVLSELLVRRSVTCSLHGDEWVYVRLRAPALRQ